MSQHGEAFIKAMGRPDPSAEGGPACHDPAAAAALQALRTEVGGGWFKDRFLYLFGDELDTLRPCLDAWSFLVRGGSAGRTIIGRNAHGALLVMEDGNAAQHVFVLDPFRVAYWGDYGLTLQEAAGHALCQPGLLSEFLDDGAYRAWVKEYEAELDMEDVLGFKVPKALGGTISADNLQLDGMVEYYQETAPIYEGALRKQREAPCEVRFPGPQFELNYAKPCEVETDKCDGSKQTGLVNRMPGFKTTFVCRPCYEEKTRTGAWTVQG
jgi:hypothetical protein